MPFVKRTNRDKGSRIISSRLVRGKTTNQFKRHVTTSNASSDSSNGFVENDPQLSKEANVEDIEFNLEEDNAAHFLVTGEVIKKKGRYEERKERELESWESVNEKMVEQYYSRYENLFQSPCIICNTTLEHCLVWCKECGPACVYCPSCAFDIHKKMPFHTPVEVLVSLF